VFRVNGNQLIGSCESGPDERTPRHQRLLVGKCNGRTRCNGREGWPQPHGARDAIHNNIGADARGLDHPGGAPHHHDLCESRRFASGDDSGDGGGVSHGHEARTHGRRLRCKSNRIRSPCGESNHLEATGISRDDVQSLNAYRAGRSQERDRPGRHCAPNRMSTARARKASTVRSS